MAITTRRHFLRQAGAGVLGAAAAVGNVQALAQQPARPNILLIVTDQQSATMLSCAGNTWLKTPAMDSLMTRGMRFEKAYATNPVCMPSRFSMFSGHYPSAVGIRANGASRGAEKFAPRAMGHTFRSAGYQAVYGGKVHLPGKMGSIAACGFDALTGDQRDELAAKCAAFLSQPHDKPFLLVASFINPHDICYQAIVSHANRGQPRKGGGGGVAVRRMLEAAQMPVGVAEQQFYQTLCPPLPANHEPTVNEPKGVAAGLKDRAFKPWIRQNWTDKQWRLHRWTYCRLTEVVDKQIGIVLAALRKAGLEDDTVVVLTSDHGDMDSAHRMEHKSWTYEEAARIPLLVQYPPLTKPGLVDTKHLVSNGLDLYPTLCDLAGVKPPEKLPGQSFKPLLGGQTPQAWRRYLLIEAQFSNGVTDGRYKYTLFDSAGPEELLVDLQTDPGEMHNLAGKPAHAETLTRMRQALADQAAAHGVKLRYPVPSSCP